MLANSNPPPPQFVLREGTNQIQKWLYKQKHRKNLGFQGKRRDTSSKNDTPVQIAKGTEQRDLARGDST